MELFRDQIKHSKGCHILEGMPVLLEHEIVRPTDFSVRCIQLKETFVRQGSPNFSHLINFKLADETTGRHVTII